MRKLFLNIIFAINDTEANNRLLTYCHSSRQGKRLLCTPGMGANQWGERPVLVYHHEIASLWQGRCRACHGGAHGAETKNGVWHAAQAPALREEA